MGGAALAKIDLDCVGLPVSALTADYNEIDRETTQGTEVSQPVPDLGSLTGDERSVSRIGGESTAEETLSGRSAQELVVSREDLDVAQRRHPHLDTGTGEVASLDSFFDDASQLR